MRLLEGRAHLVRVAGLFLAGLLVFAIVRALAVPADFGVYGHYRASALEDSRKPPVVHAGQAACVECHTDVGELRAKGRHAGISCEACHGAQARHAAAVDESKPERPHGRDACVNCHAANVARPAKHPQVDIAEHAGDSLCTACHVPHQPAEAPEAK